MKSAWDTFLHTFPLICVVLFLGWVYWQWLKRTQNPVALTVRWIVTGIVLAPIFIMAAKSARTNDDFGKGAAIILSLIGGLAMVFIWRQQFCDFVGDLFASIYTGGNQEVDPAPFYSMAEGRRKQGRYQEAIEEVNQQLSRFPNDFQGWMLLAEIYAEDLKDLPASLDTVEQILAQPDHSPKNIAFALNRVADWHLKIAQDREAARAALERIVQLMPDTEQAHLALQRVAHLTPEEMLRQKVTPAPIALPKGEENIGLRLEPVAIGPTEEDPSETAGKYVRHLEEHPYDNETREKLALIYARHYRKLDMAVDQLEQLVAYPNQPSKQVVHWLNLLADLQIEFANDVESARAALNRIIELYPKTAAAENAKNRIAYLKLELRPQQERRAVKLGTYEQNIGLKKGWQNPPS